MTKIHNEKLIDQECPICKSNKIEMCYSGILNIHVSSENFSVLKCNNCSHAFTFPLPELKTFTALYGDDYYSYNINIDHYNDKIKFKIKKLLYANDNKNLISNGIRSFIGNQVSIFPKLKKSNPNLKILDIGCGNGAFLSFMKALNLDTYGIDISSRAIETAKQNGHKVIFGTIEDTVFPDDFFDIITINNVLEHLHDPVFVLKKINRMLKIGGELIICVPNFDCFGRKSFGKEWDGLAIPWHIHHFTMKSLKNASKAANFLNTQEKYIYRDLIRSSLINYSGRNKHDLRYYFLIFKGILLYTISNILFLPILFKLSKRSCSFITLHSRKL
jgi:2-polyprenyl-3-methyl-5-hydroxy-6-metoxy-1,4-benzoquinol methylase